eukprot:4298584-Heterocapsa_arctica.AAC.1
MEVDDGQEGQTGTYAQEGTAAPSPESTKIGASDGDQAAWVSLINTTKGQSRLPFRPPPGLAPLHPAEA